MSTFDNLDVELGCVCIILIPHSLFFDSPILGRDAVLLSPIDISITFPFLFIATLISLFILLVVLTIKSMISGCATTPLSVTISSNFPSSSRIYSFIPCLFPFTIIPPLYIIKQKYFNIYYFLPRLFDFSVHAETAFIIVPLKFPFSKISSASIVVPPGDVTSSFKTPGCFPVSRTIFADP